MDDGYIKLCRKFFTGDFWETPRIYSLAEAWLDLVQSASFRDRKRLIQGNLIEEPRGCIIASVRFLCDRWGWSNTKVLHFLTLLRKEQMVATEKRQGITLIRLCNFEKYNGEKRQQNDGETTGKRQGDDEREEGKKDIDTHIGPLPQETAVVAFAATLVPPCEESYARKWFEENESRGWIDRNKLPIRKWKPALSAWWRGVNHNQAERKHLNGKHEPQRTFKEMDQQRDADLHKKTSKFGI